MGKEVRKWSNWWSKALDAFLPTIPLRAPDLSPLITDSPKWERYDVAGSRWFGSLCNRLITQFDYEYPELMLGDRVMGTWNRERDILFGRQEPGELVAFDPSKYVLLERERKKVFNQASMDALMGLEGRDRLSAVQAFKQLVRSPPAQQRPTGNSR